MHSHLLKEALCNIMAIVNAPIVLHKVSLGHVSLIGLMKALVDSQTGIRDIAHKPRRGDCC